MNKISDSELEIMKVLWQKGKVTSPEIIESLSKVNDWEKTTIKTLITRLVQKGAVKQSKKEGALYTYEALITEREYKKTENKSFIEKLYQGSINNLLLNFVEEKQISKKDLKKLLAMIDDD